MTDYVGEHYEEVKRQRDRYRAALVIAHAGYCGYECGFDEDAGEIDHKPECKRIADLLRVSEIKPKQEG